MSYYYAVVYAPPHESTLEAWYEEVAGRMKGLPVSYVAVYSVAGKMEILVFSGYSAKGMLQYNTPYEWNTIGARSWHERMKIVSPVCSLVYTNGVKPLSRSDKATSRWTSYMYHAAAGNVEKIPEKVYEQYKRKFDEVTSRSKPPVEWLDQNHD